MMTWILALGIAYLLGSIPFGYLLVRFYRKEDIRHIGSGNIGATNVTRSGAKGLGALTLLLDALKGWLAVVIAQHLAVANGFPDAYNIAAAAALAAVVGHMFPVWLKFKGGKGVATALGIFLAVSPFAAMCGFCIFIVIVIFTQYVSLSSIIGSLMLAAITLFYDDVPSIFAEACYLIIVALVIAKHHRNLHRLANGTENRFSFTKRSKS